MRIGKYLGWTAFAILAAVVYGVVNDQITVSIAPEYFSIIKRAQMEEFFDTFGLTGASPRVQAVAVGAISTWWVGLILGGVLSFAGLAGDRPPCGFTQFLRVVITAMLITFALSLIGGAIGWLVEPVLVDSLIGLPFFAGVHNLRAAVAVGEWHDGAYLGGLVGGILGFISLRKQRASSFSGL